MLSAGLASAFAPRVGVRLVAAIGLIVSIAGMLLLIRLPVDGSYVSDVLPSIILTSLGMGAVFMPLTLIATTGLDDDDQGLASGLFNTSQQVGGSVGLAILTTVATSQTKAFEGTDTAALVHGFHYAFAGAAVLLAISLVALLALLRERDVAKIMAEASTSAAPAAI